MDDGPVVEMRGINKSFSNVQVLHDVNLQLKKEVLGLVGKNGAGKSTLMKILFGVEKADSGTIKVFGEEYEPSKTLKGKSKDIAMIFQEFSLIPSLTTAENIFLSNLQKGRLGLLDRNACRREASVVLDSLHVDVDPDVKVSSLSISQKQSVEIAKAVSEDRKILIMDEPSAALSSDQVESLFDLIRGLKAKGISIIYISHNLRQIFKICDRIAIIRNGKNVLTVETSQTDLDEVIAGITGEEQPTIVRQLREREQQGRSKEEIPILRIRNVSYKRKVNNVSFDVYPGEIVGIAGLTGSGRTELLEAVFGINRFDSGTVFIDGTEVKLTNPRVALENGLILIPDDRQVKGLVLDHSVRSNTILPILDKLKNLIFINNKKSKSIAHDLVEKLRIVTAGIEHRVASLSGGNQQKVVLSKAISTDSKILLLDDPTAGVDVESKEEIAGIIKEFVIANRNAAIFVSSEMEMISEVCDRVLIMRNGKIVQELDKTNGEDISEPKLLALV